MDSAELAHADRELEHRGEAICLTSDVVSTSSAVVGRSDASSAAAAWLLERVLRADIFDPEFVERFAHLTRIELLWAAIEHRTLVGTSIVSLPPRVAGARG